MQPGNHTLEVDIGYLDPESLLSSTPWVHIWELPGNCPVLTVGMVIYHLVERTWIILVTPNFCITYMIMNEYYTGEPVNIHIQSLMNIMQDNNRVISTKKGKGKLPLFRGNGKWVIPIYAP